MFGDLFGAMLYDAIMMMCFLGKIRWHAYCFFVKTSNCNDLAIALPEMVLAMSPINLAQGGPKEIICEGVSFKF